MKALRFLAVTSIFSLGACSGGIDSKEDAATALNRLMMASSNASTMAGASTAGLTSMFSVDAAVTVNGRSGTATVKTTAAGSFTGASASLDIAFSGFSADGKNTFDGNETYSNVAAFSGTSFSVNRKLVADVKISGEYNAQMTCDVNVAMSATAQSETGGKVTMVIDGTVTAQGRTFRFENETFSVNVEI